MWDKSGSINLKPDIEKNTFCEVITEASAFVIPMSKGEFNKNAGLLWTVESSKALKEGNGAFEALKRK